MLKNEVELLAKINRTLSVKTLERYEILQTKKSEKALTETEFQELSNIVEQKELLNAERFDYFTKSIKITSK